MQNLTDPTILKDKNVFIVEDNVENRVIFQMIFVKYGATVHFERWGRDTVRHLQATSQVDLIILDLMLRDNISGFDLYDAIRALPRFGATPIVAVSAMDSALALSKTRSKGFNGFIAKPIDNQLFPRQMAALIEGKEVWYTGERYFDSV